MRSFPVVTIIAGSAVVVALVVFLLILMTTPFEERHTSFSFPLESWNTKMRATTTPSVTGRRPEKIHNSHVRLDCFPDPQPNAETCTRRGCIWNATTVRVGEPCCFYPTNYGYEVKRVVDDQQIILQKRPVVDELEWISEPISVVKMTWEYLEDGTTHVKFVDPSKQRYEVPLQLWPEGKPAPMDVSRSNVVVIVPVEGSFFSFQVLDKPSGRMLFDTSVGGFVFNDKFLQITSYLPSKNLYGFGENAHQHLRHNMSYYETWPMFSRDQAPLSESLLRNNLYSVHPFYLCLTNDGTSFGGFFLNSNAQEYTIGPGPFVTYRTIGGILDIYLFRGPKPADVIAQYWGLIGKPTMPAYWSLGFQLSRYGYSDTNQIRQTVERMRKNGIPQDVQYADIDYMDNCKDFTVDPVKFGDLQAYVEETQKQGLRWIFILDPAINAVVQNYAPFSDGKLADTFITWPNRSMVPSVNDQYENTKGTTLMLGTVWPLDNVVFPDFLNAITKQWWQHQTTEFRRKLKYDGLWIDMNEPTNFLTNQKVPRHYDHHLLKDIPSLMCPVNEYDDPPYATQGTYMNGPGSRLSDKTLCMIAKQGPYVHYDVHSLYGWSQSIATIAAVRQATGERGIVLSRSTYPGSGRYVGHWLGDNFSKWVDMRNSIIGVLEFSLFGIPYIGADICGFQENTTEELCARWHQLGSFYPFSRNHNDLNSRSQDPAQWPTVANATRASLNNRYALMPYLYTLFYKAHNRSETVARPLFFQFPRDSMTYDVDRQFMWGPAIIITAVLEQGVNEVPGYFPHGLWYNIYQEEAFGQLISPGFHTVTSTISESVPIHLRGGYTLATQKPELSTMETRRNPLKLLIALDENCESHGDLYWDDGASVNVTNCHVFLEFYFVAHKNSWNLSVALTDGGCSQLVVPPLKALDILGLEEFGPNTRCQVESEPAEADFTYSTKTKRLIVQFSKELPLNLQHAGDGMHIFCFKSSSI